MVRVRQYMTMGALALVTVAAAACGGSDGSGGSGGAAAGAPGDGSDKDVPAADGAVIDDDGTSDPGADACEIVTVAEIEEVLGTGPVAEGHLNGAMCGWPVGQGGAAGVGGSGNVGISVTDTTRYSSTAEEAMGSMREGFGGAAVEIAGLGDEAVGDGAGMLAFRTGDWYVTVGVYRDQDPASNQAAAEELALMVLDRL